MSERMYLIVPLGYPLKEVDGSITESELKRRCEIVASILSGHSPGVRGWNEAMDILLHGDESDVNSKR